MLNKIASKTEKKPKPIKQITREQALKNRDGYNKARNPAVWALGWWYWNAQAESAK